MKVLRVLHRTPGAAPAWLLAGLAALAGASPAHADRFCNPNQFPLLVRIGATPDQAQALVPIFEEAIRLRLEYHRTMSELLPQMVETYQVFRDEDAIGQGFKKKTERTTGQLHGKEVQLHDAFSRSMLGLEQRVRSVLNTEQLYVLTALPHDDPCGRAQAAMSHVTGGRMTALGAAVDPGIADTVERMHEVSQYRHPRPTRIGDRLLHPDVAEQVYYFAGETPSNEVAMAVQTLRQVAHPQSTYQAYERERGRLGGEISAWNLVNGLHLDKNQATAILQCAYQGEVLRKQFEHAAVTRFDHGPDKVRYQLAMAPAVVESLYQLERRVVDVMSDGQVQVVQEFNPCLLPPKNLSDPVRAGQTKDNTAMSRFFARVRSLPSDERTAAVDRWMVREERQFGKYDAAYLADRRAQLLDALDKTAEMDDTHFAVHQKGLAERLQPVDVRTELRYDLEGLLTSRRIPGRIAQTMLFDQHMTRVLAMRAEQLTRQAEIDRRHAKHEYRADNCDNGKCALTGRRYGKLTAK